MNVIRPVAAIAAMMITTSVAAHAAPIVIDPDAFAAGTVLNNAFAGVTLTAIGDAGVLANANVLSATDALAPTGTRVFADTSGSPNYWGDGSFSFLRADFAGGATFVSLDFAANDGSDANPFLRAFDAADNLIDSSTAGAVTFGVPITLSVSGASIAYITASWDDTERSNNGILDNLQFEPAQAPEPGTLLMLGVGLASVSVRRWRSRSRS